MDGDSTARATAWPDGILSELRRWQVRQVAYVPDGGHARLIRAVHADPAMRAIPLTTEEEGIAVLAGAALGGQRGVLPMQSCGVGNCVKLLSLAKACRFPFLALVTMRGEWASSSHGRCPWPRPPRPPSASWMSRCAAPAQGPRVAVVEIDPAEPPPRVLPSREGAHVRARMMAALGLAA